MRLSVGAEAHRGPEVLEGFAHHLDPLMHDRLIGGGGTEAELRLGGHVLQLGRDRQKRVQFMRSSVSMPTIPTYSK